METVLHPNGLVTGIRGQLTALYNRKIYVYSLLTLSLSWVHVGDTPDIGMNILCDKDLLFLTDFIELKVRHGAHKLYDSHVLHYIAGALSPYNPDM